MASSKAIIGKNARVKGRVHGSQDLTIEGRVEGEVTIDGDVMVESSGLVAANISGHVITVRGAIKGDLIATEAVRLEEGARVVGDLRAPRVAIAPGALVRGYVQTAQNGKVEAPVRRPAAVSRPQAAPAVRSAPTPAPARLAPVVAKHNKPEPKPAARPAISIAGGVKAPPPPIVPALKKGAKGALKKKA